MTIAAATRADLYARLREIGTDINPGATERTWAACIPLHVDTGAPRIERDLAYGPHQRHRLDLHLPADQPDEPAPVLVFVHGGGFVAGEKSRPGLPFHDNVGGWAARHGLLGVTINYRLAPGDPWPAGIEDLGRAVAWVRDHIASRGGDPDRIVLVGHSAGAAHVAGYLGTGAAVAAAALLSCPFDLADGGENPFTAAYYGRDVALHPQREPLAALTRSRVPVLLTVAELDPPDFHRQALAALTALHARDGALPPFARISGHNHFSEVASLGIDDTLSVPLLQFVRLHTARPQPSTGRRPEDGMPVRHDDHEAVRRVIENWALWRDAGDWDRFATVWHRDGFMSATWFQGTATEFIAASRAGFDRGVRILHFLGGTSVDIRGDRAISQNKMTITQRAFVHDVEVDVVCTGRFYDFLSRDGGEWRIVRRQPIYEQDRLDPVDPAAGLKLDSEVLAAYPVGYRHLAYLQRQIGFDVKNGLPGLTGAAVEGLYREGAAWLDGSERPGVPA